MATIAIEKKRKNIDLSVDTLKKLSLMAASQGKMRKGFHRKSVGNQSKFFEYRSFNKSEPKR